MTDQQEIDLFKKILEQYTVQKFQIESTEGVQRVFAATFPYTLYIYGRQASRRIQTVGPAIHIDLRISYSKAAK